MKVNEMKRVLESLDQQGHTGLGVFSLANATGIRPDRLRRIFKKHKNYFVQLPEKNVYTINRFGDGKGKVDAMLVHYEKHLESNKRSQFYCYFVLFLSLCIVLINNS